MTTNLELIRSIPERRVLWLRGKLTENRANRLIAELKLLSKRSQKPILLRVVCRGGSLKWSLEVAETIRKLKAPVYAVVTKAYSGALIIVQVCDLRIGRSRSKYCIHYNRLPLSFLLATPYMDTEAIKKYLDDRIEPLLRETWMPAHLLLLASAVAAGKTEDELNSLLREDRFIDAHEARGWGFIDDVLDIKFVRR